MSLAKWPHIAAGFLTAEQTPLTTAGVNPLSGVLSVLWPTVFLIIIMYLAYKSTLLIRKSYDGRVGTNSRIEILERSALGPDKYLVVVRIGGDILLLGVAAGSVNKLATLDAGLYDDVPPIKEGGGFDALLRGVVDKGFGGIPGEKRNIQ